MEIPVIEIKKLKKYYGRTKGIDEVSLKINKGEIYGFIGPNGAGKSTTIRTLIGLINKSSGEIYINGTKLNNYNNDFKQRIGYLPSEINLYNDMTIKELFNYHESFYKKSLSEKRKELVKLFKIDENKKVEELSLGNLKKVGISLALMHEPEILILDEPTSGLDPIMQKVLHDILIKEKNKGTTILYSSHVLNDVSNICDKVGFIKEGKVIREDSINNIKKNNFTYLTIISKDISNIKKELALKIIYESSNEIKCISDITPNKLIEKLSKYKMDKLLIEEVPLEDLFMNYYR